LNNNKYYLNHVSKKNKYSKLCDSCQDQIVCLNEYSGISKMKTILRILNFIPNEWTTMYKPIEIIEHLAKPNLMMIDYFVKIYMKQYGYLLTYI
jgi:hypothetical protein